MMDMNGWTVYMNHWTIFKDSATLIITLGTAVSALRTYRMNAETGRTDLLRKLHREFFVEEHYKPMRAILDEHASPEALTQEISEESSRFTDYLNFFELIGYLDTSSKWFGTSILPFQDVEAVPGYYLRSLRDNGKIRAYISQESRSFEHLNRLLAKLDGEK